MHALYDSFCRPCSAQDVLRVEHEPDIARPTVFKLGMEVYYAVQNQESQRHRECFFKDVSAWVKIEGPDLQLGLSGELSNVKQQHVWTRSSSSM